MKIKDLGMLRTQKKTITKVTKIGGWLFVGLFCFLNPVLGSAWRDYYIKATTATFYSASVLNGYFELKLANAYLDSCKIMLKKFPPSAEEIREANLLLANLESELKVSKGIAADNMNYQYPSFSVMAGHHADFNELDDTEELLIEAITDRVINSADPLLKGNLKDNTHFVLVGMKPFNETLFTVVLDYLATNTGFYAIRTSSSKLTSPAATFENASYNSGRIPSACACNTT